MNPVYPLTPQTIMSISRPLLMLLLLAANEDLPADIRNDPLLPSPSLGRF